MSPAFHLPLAAIARYMRMGGQVPDGALVERVESLREEALKVFRLARVWRRMDLPLPVESQALARHLAGCPSAYLVCGTIGAEFDALQRRVAVTSGADALIVQAIGAAAVEKHMDTVDEEIRAELAPGESLVSRYSPGYGDFPLEASRRILELLDAPRRMGVSLTDSLLLVPSKTVTAVAGVKHA